MKQAPPALGKKRYTSDMPIDRRGLSELISAANPEDVEVNDRLKSHAAQSVGLKSEGVTTPAMLMEALRKSHMEPLADKIAAILAQ